MNSNELKNEIRQTIYSNRFGDISGNELRDILLEIVNSQNRINGDFEEANIIITNPNGEFVDSGKKLSDVLSSTQGATGPQGVTGLRGPKGDKGETGATGPTGENGLTPYIGENGNWWIGTTDTGVKAQGPTGGGGSGEGVVYTAGNNIEIENNTISAIGYKYNTELWSFAEGYGATASGYSSHAEGSGTIASGDDSHAEGAGTEASGYYSHAEGAGTTASGDSSHAEGASTTASGYASHAEGSGTIASGTGAHAEGGSGSIGTGDFSHAEGGHTQAEGWASHAEGADTVASGEMSHTEGSCTIASGQASHAEGYYTGASGSYSHAEGSGTIASGEASHAEGSGSIAYGSNSHAEGRSTIAFGLASHAGGYNSQANGDYSFVHGYNCTVHTSGENAHTIGIDNYVSNSGCIALGKGLTTYRDYCTYLGQYNKQLPSDWADVIAVVGDGTDSLNQRNIVVIQSGNEPAVHCRGAFKNDATWINDFGEYFEWADGNPGGEDRVGYMVQLNEEKIELAQSYEKCIGVVSATAGFIGGACSFDWHGIYLRDEFGRYILDENGNPTINPEYDETKEYLPRSKRPEWSIIGILGQVITRQDGTLISGGFASCINGIATNADSGYCVLKVLSDKTALLLIR